VPWGRRCPECLCALTALMLYLSAAAVLARSSTLLVGHGWYVLTCGIQCRNPFVVGRESNDTDLRLSKYTIPSCIVFRLVARGAGRGERQFIFKRWAVCAHSEAQFSWFNYIQLLYVLSGGWRHGAPGSGRSTSSCATGSSRGSATGASPSPSFSRRAQMCDLVY